jgi:hypothetical protein
MLQSLAYAKVEDFNAIINEDIKAQKELHQQFKNQVNKDNVALQQELNNTKKPAKVREVFIVDNVETNYIAPSSNNFLKFNKELKQKSQNERKNQHRVAKEIKELGL